MVLPLSSFSLRSSLSPDRTGPWTDYFRVFRVFQISILHFQFPNLAGLTICNSPSACLSVICLSTLHSSVLPPLSLTLSRSLTVSTMTPAQCRQPWPVTHPRWTLRSCTPVAIISNPARPHASRRQSWLSCRLLLTLLSLSTEHRTIADYRILCPSPFASSAADRPPTSECFRGRTLISFLPVHRWISFDFSIVWCKLYNSLIYC